MKIGIVTFYYAHNYGAVLQAYALKTYLKQKGHEVYMFPHINENIAAMYPREMRPVFPKKYIAMPLKWKYILVELKRVMYSKTDWHNRYLKFESFIEKHLSNDIPTQIEAKDFFDVIFFGSDQIWERNLIGNDLTYVGRIDSEAVKVSYAASCFSNNSVFTDVMVEELKKFYKLSARERDVAKKIGDLTSKNVAIVCDPVFLLDAKEYKKILPHGLIEEEYTLFYFVAEDDELEKICSYLRTNNKRKVLEIHYSKLKKENSDYRIDYGPEEFLYLIMNAQEVYTNSFHGTAFSIIFHKQFYVKSNNMRLLNILNILQLSNRVINKIDQFVDVGQNSWTFIDYDAVEQLKKEYVAVSKNYIDDILKEIGVGL